MSTPTTISLRDYFAMQAPPVPEDYKACPPHEPQTPADLDLTKKERKYYEQWYIEEQSDWNPDRPNKREYECLVAKIAAHDKAWVEYSNKMNAYDMAKSYPDLNRIAEWRYAYADMMMVERKHNPDSHL